MLNVIGNSRLKTRIMYLTNDVQQVDMAGQHGETRIVCVQVRTRPIRDILNSVE